MKNKILPWTNKIVAAFLLLLGILAFVTSLKDLEFGTFSSPKGGFAPTVFSAGLIIFSLINLVLEMFKKNEVPEKLKDVNWLKWLLYMLICIAYVFLVKKIGFAVDTFICLFAMLKLTGRKGVVKPILISGVFSVIVWAIFTYAMNVPLPGASWF
ncbi:tripartite tricarboxylate transporter TctB family protein [Ruthenibacterium sp. CLA-JM-H11]|uniref:Tripartite tricarboxylate transporter TctB family protein n=1 Tax=Ruthenibacterium intestinale TaxID=3133163 RepID=A0ABV1GH22_9FIRM